MPTIRYNDAEGAFSVTCPAGWESEKDTDGGLLLYSPTGSGLLHLIPFGREFADDPGEELYAFLAEQEIELEEEEVEDVPLSDGSFLALCEYAAEEEDDSDDEGEVHWIVGVAATPGLLVFASYSCAAGEEEEEGAVVREILKSLVLERAEGSAAD